LLLVAAAFVCLIGAPVRAADVPPFPSPLEGPGGGTLTRSQQKKLERAWRDLNRGELAKSAKRATRAGDSRQTRLLLLQNRLVDGDEDAVGDLAALCQAHPDYANAWGTLSLVAERSGDEGVALHAARRAADLWPDSWKARADRLERQWLDDRIARAAALVDREQYDAALGELARATAIEPDRPDAALVKSEALCGAGRLDECETVLDTILDQPRALVLKAGLAERRGDWQTAMECYSALPDGYPERSALLNRAKIRWRLTMLPPSSQEAIASAALTRGQLAIVLVAVEPRLEALPGGNVPVMSDIVDHPGQREIIAVVRLDIMHADRREHQFHPSREVDAATVRRAVDRARSLVGEPPLTWCPDENVVGSACTPMPTPPSGGAVVNAMLDSESGTGP
jgi:tetratricopeptide (TPR) repeat protein